MLISGSFRQVSPLPPYKQQPAAEQDLKQVPRYASITLRRGKVCGKQFFNWLETGTSAEPCDVTISLLDESHQQELVWKVKNAWPVRLQGPGLKATGNEAAIESIELSHEGITIQK